MHLGLYALLRRGQLFLLVLHVDDLLVEAVELRQGGLLAFKGDTGKVLSPHAERLAGLVVQLAHVLARLLGLKLETALGRDHLHDAALDVAKHLKLLLVGVVEGLLRVLGVVDQAVHLRLHDGRHPR